MRAKNGERKKIFERITLFFVFYFSTELKWFLTFRGTMSEEVASDAPTLSKYPQASFRELLFLSIPLILGLFSASFMGFCDRLFLARYSLSAWEGCVTASNLVMLFQHPIMRIVIMTQVFVGLYYGSKKLNQIGPAVWQMIWLCLFSVAITLPISTFVATFFFEGTSVQAQASLYFSTMMFANFLFPMGTALSVFFIGQGRMSIIFLTTLISHSLNVVLDYFFIFGFKGIIPSMGVFGAAMATGIAQLVYCAILMGAFLRKKERETFNTGDYTFRWDAFWTQFRAGFPRAIGRLIILSAWVSITRLMTLKGGDYLMVLSIGSTLILLFTFINDGMLQGMVTIASNIIGQKKYAKLWKLVRSGLLLLSITTAILAIPHLILSDFTLSFFFSEPLSPRTLIILKRSCVWLWLFFFCYGFNIIGLSLVAAARDMTFYLFAIPFVWLTSYVPVYFAMEKWNWSPDRLWLIMAMDSLLFGLLFIFRSSKEKWRQRIDSLSLELK